jgi:hypothetical protein
MEKDFGRGMTVTYLLPDPTNGTPPGCKMLNSLHPFRDLPRLEKSRFHRKLYLSLSRVRKSPVEIRTAAMTICVL